MLWPGVVEVKCPLGAQESSFAEAARVDRNFCLQEYCDGKYKLKHEHEYYRSVPHIRPLFCNLSASRKRKGGLYAGSDILSREYAPLLVPRLDVDIGTLRYSRRSWFDMDRPSLLLSSRNSMVKID